jgi:uncharacterized protein
VSVLFLDSSGLAKRYVMEPGSFWVSDLLDPDHENIVYISGLARVEVVSALMKKERMGGIDTAQTRNALMQFEYHLENEYQILEPTPELLEEAKELVKAYPLRAYDAVQLVTAMTLDRLFRDQGEPPILFLSADDGLNQTALEGLHMENPNRHPAATPIERDLEEGR